MTARTVLLTVTAMVAFAANSLLCRMAIGPGAIDAVSFTALRTVSGAVILALLVLPRWRGAGQRPTFNRASGAMALALFAYMIFFSLAYQSLTAATGALLLFGAVQLTMFAVALAQGERYGARRWFGLALALAGLAYLLLPGVQAPDPRGAAFMVISGVAWGAYSLLGRRAGDPIQSTAANFFLAAPLTLLAWAVLPRSLELGVYVEPEGVALALLSGVFASALGYVVWYAALRGLDAGRAATVQLSVPVIAALGGVLLLDELLDQRLVLAAILTLGGIGLVLTRDKNEKDEKESA